MQTSFRSVHSKCKLMGLNHAGEVDTIVEYRFVDLYFTLCCSPHLYFVTNDVFANRIDELFYIRVL
jgi:hypothetical protein